jgi:hypothetical protein
MCVSDPFTLLFLCRSARNPFYRTALTPSPVRRKNNSRKLDYSGGGSDHGYSRRPLPPDPPPSATFNDGGVGYSSSSAAEADQRSIYSLDSQHSAESSIDSYGSRVRFQLLIPVLSRAKADPATFSQHDYPSQQQSYWRDANEDSAHSHNSYGNGMSLPVRRLLTPFLLLSSSHSYLPALTDRRGAEHRARRTCARSVLVVHVLFFLGIRRRWVRAS